MSWDISVGAPEPAAGSFTWRRDRLTLSPTVSWKKDSNITLMKCRFVAFFGLIFCCIELPIHPILEPKAMLLF